MSYKDSMQSAIQNCLRFNQSDCLCSGVLGLPGNLRVSLKMQDKASLPLRYMMRGVSLFGKMPLMEDAAYRDMICQRMSSAMTVLNPAHHKSEC